MHEAETHKQNCFITLTYKPSDLPPLGSIDKKAPVLFMKRLRKRFGDNIRSFGCAEYGEKRGRPHYHICLFNFDFPDKKLVTVRNGYDVWTSQALEELWPHGKSEIGTLTFDSAAYVARYVTKKKFGKDKQGAYDAVDEHGEIRQKEPETTVCVSRRPGLGRAWLEKFKKGVRQNDSIIVDGKEVKPPKYYDRIWELEDPVEFDEVKQKRIASARAKALKDARDPEEVLAIKEYLQWERMEKLHRRFEDE